MLWIVMVYSGVFDVVVFSGFNINGFINSLSLGILFMLFKFFNECQLFELLVGVIVVKLNQQFGVIKGVYVVIFLFLLVMGLGIIGGFRL